MTSSSHLRHLRSSRTLTLCGSNSGFKPQKIVRWLSIEVAQDQPWRETLRRILKTPAAGLVLTLQEEVPKHTFNLVHASAAFAKLAKHRKALVDQAGKAALILLAERTGEMLSEQSSGYERELCSITWAVAKLRGRAAPFRGSLVPVIVKSFPVETGKLNSLDVSNMFWALATLRKEAPQLQCLTPALIREALLNVDTMAAQAVANILWSLGILGANNAQARILADLLCCHASKTLPDLKPQEMANMCWGLALCGQKDVILLEQLATLVASRASSLPDRSAEFDLPQIVLAFAKLGIWHPALMQAVAHRTAAILASMNPWGVCALSWSCEQLVPGEELCSFREMLAAEVSDRCFTAEEVDRSQFGPEGFQ